MSDLHRLRRYSYKGEGDEIAELVSDLHWAADEIERLRLVLQTIADEGGNEDFECLCGCCHHWDGAVCSRYASQALSDTETQEKDDE